MGGLSVAKQYYLVTMTHLFYVLIGAAEVQFYTEFPILLFYPVSLLYCSCDKLCLV